MHSAFSCCICIGVCGRPDNVVTKRHWIGSQETSLDLEANRSCHRLLIRQFPILFTVYWLVSLRSVVLCDASPCSVSFVRGAHNDVDVISGFWTISTAQMCPLLTNVRLLGVRPCQRHVPPALAVMALMTIAHEKLQPGGPSCILRWLPCVLKVVHCHVSVDTLSAGAQTARSRILFHASSMR